MKDKPFKTSWKTLSKKNGDLKDAIKQMLILSWINANIARRQDLLTELESLAAINDMNLIREVIETIVEISEVEQEKVMVSNDYYLRFSMPSKGSDNE